MTEIEALKPLRHCGTKKIETERLVLRQFEQSDCKDMYQWASNMEVVRYLSYYPHKNEEETRRILQGWIDAYKNLMEAESTLDRNGKMCYFIHTKRKI